jgi:hypothetical protein
MKQEQTTEEIIIDKRKITEDEKQIYEQKAIELAAKYKVAKVHVCVLIKSDSEDFERLVAYVREPDYMSKLALMDKASTLGIRMAAEELRMMFQCTGQDESHPYTCSDLAEFERYKLGVAEFCIGIVQISVDQLKKN